MLNKKRIILATLGATAAIALVLTQTAGSNRQYQLGGSFIGSGGAGIWSAMQTPLDPAGRTAALRVKSGTHSAGLAGLFAALGATTASDNVGEMEMINCDTAAYRTVSHAVMPGPDSPLEINSILVMTGTVKFTGPDTMDVTYTINVYPVNIPNTSPFYGLPNADVDSDGFPDPGAQRIVIPGSVLPPQLEGRCLNSS